MMVVAVLVEPPRPGPVFSELMEASSLSEVEAADLYTVMLKNVCIAIERSDGDLPINYRAEDGLPDELAGDHDSEAEIRSVVVDALGGTDSTRFEPQVSLTFSAHADDIVSYLLNEEEEVHSAVAVRPIAPLLGHAHLGSAAMKFRSAPVILGPPAEGHAYFSDFLNPIDLTDAYMEPGTETLACRIDDAGHGFDYILILPVPETGVNPATVVPMLRSRVESEQLVPECTTTFVFEEGFQVESTDGILELIRD